MITDGWADQIVGVDASVPVLDGTMRRYVSLDNAASTQGRPVHGSEGRYQAVALDRSQPGGASTLIDNFATLPRDVLRTKYVDPGGPNPFFRALRLCSHWLHWARPGVPAQSL